MTLEELWKLFPIFLTEHQETWKEWYLEADPKIVGKIVAQKLAAL